MRLNKLLVYLGLVVLLCTLSSSWAEDEVPDVEDDDEAESDSENEQDDKASDNRVECLKYIASLS